MKLFDENIRKTQELLSAFSNSSFDYQKSRGAPEGDKNELILSREAAFEMGEGKLPGVSYTMITDSEDLVPKDEILLYGKDLTQLKENTPFARIVILRTDNVENFEEKMVYGIIQSLAMIPYNISPRGYMMRAAAMSNGERVRVSREAKKRGLDFGQVGNLFIQKYKESKYVKGVKIIFITLPEAPYSKLEELAEGTGRIVKAMNHLLSDINMDCTACEWKPVCDEVEGMKELHSSIQKKE